MKDAKEHAEQVLGMELRQDGTHEVVARVFSVRQHARLLRAQLVQAQALKPLLVAGGGSAAGRRRQPVHPHPSARLERTRCQRLPLQSDTKLLQKAAAALPAVVLWCCCKAFAPASRALHVSSRLAAHCCMRRSRRRARGVEHGPAALPARRRLKLLDDH